jgi:hypothetical protein
MNADEMDRLEIKRPFFSKLRVHLRLSVVIISARRSARRSIQFGGPDSTGYPASIQASSPPSSALTFEYPLCNMMNAARALVCSFGQVQ